MNTLTIFNAFAGAAWQSHETCVRLAGSAAWLPAPEVARLIRFARRRDRQIATFQRAIHARLAPPAVQCSRPHRDYADDLVNDSEAGRISEDDIS